MVIFDECHLITSKTNKKVMTALYNTIIRVGLSGTPFSHKDPTKNMDVRSFFGDEVYKIKNTELMDLGYSTPIVIKIIKGNTKIKIKGDYDEEYKQGISASAERTERSLERIGFYLRRGHSPILIVGRYHEHVENLYEAIQGRFGDDYRVRYIHHKIKDRKEILDLFKAGEVDILVASLIIKLGQNMPLIRYMQNAAGGDSAINALQLIGRAVRKHASKKKVYYEDFWDEGAYLRRHSKHRIAWYKKEGFKVIEQQK
jgi:superfamily II DNA or RNA helicase